MTSDSRGSETRISKADSDTTCLRVDVGERVRISGGSLEGIEGIVLARRTGGRVLVELKRGLCVEIAQFLLEPTG